MGDLAPEALGLVVGIVLVVAIGPGAGGFLGFLDTFGAGLIAASLGSAAGKLLAPSQRQSALESPGYKFTGRDAVSPSRIVYGTRMIGGPIVYISTVPPLQNDVLEFIVALTTHPVEDITHIVINQDIIRISGSPDPGIASPEGNDLYDGSEGYGDQGHDYYINKDQVRPYAELKQSINKWGVLTEDLATIPNENTDAETPIRVYKCNGWATAKNSIEHAGQDNLYITKGPPTGDWFDEDVKQQKMQSACILEYKISTITASETIRNQTAIPYMDNGVITNRAPKWGTDPYPPDSNPPFILNNTRLTNCSYIYIRLEYNAEEEWRRSFPPIKFIVKGKRVYDPTDDDESDYYTTGRSFGNPRYRGWVEHTETDGTQKFDDPTTWKQTDNWGCCILDYLKDTYYGLGVRVNAPDANQSYYGHTEELSEIDWPSFAEAIEDSDELVDGNPRYTINAVVETSQTPISVVETMLQAGAGFLIYAEGKYFLRAGVYKQPDSPTDIIDESYLTGEGLKISSGVTRSEKFNKATGVYIQGFQDDDEITPEPGLTGFPTFESADFGMIDPIDRETGSPTFGLNPYLVADGEEITRDFDYPMTTSAEEAQRLTKIYLQRNRESLSVSGTFKPKILKYRVGDTVYMTLTLDANGVNQIWGLEEQYDPLDTWYTGDGPKQFMITSMSVNNDLTVEVVFVEESSWLYEWNSGDAIPADAAPNTSLDLMLINAPPHIPNWDTETPIIPIDSEFEIFADGSFTTSTTIRWNKGTGRLLIGLDFLLGLKLLNLYYKDQ
jgi:hypothetical protein